MKHSQHNDVPIPLAKIDTVRKTSRDSLAHIAVHNWKLFRVTGYAINHTLNFSEKL
jgi:hypothetical protein